MLELPTYHKFQLLALLHMAGAMQLANGHSEHPIAVNLAKFATKSAAVSNVTYMTQIPVTGSVYMISTR